MYTYLLFVCLLVCYPFPSAGPNMSNLCERRLIHFFPEIDRNNEIVGNNEIRKTQDFLQNFLLRINVKLYRSFPQFFLET